MKRVLLVCSREMRQFAQDAINAWCPALSVISFSKATDSADAFHSFNTERQDAVVCSRILLTEELTQNVVSNGGQFFILEDADNMKALAEHLFPSPVPSFAPRVLEGRVLVEFRRGVRVIEPEDFWTCEVWGPCNLSVEGTVETNGTEPVRVVTRMNHVIYLPIDLIHTLVHTFSDRSGTHQKVYQPDGA